MLIGSSVKSSFFSSGEGKLVTGALGCLTAACVIGTDVRDQVTLQVIMEWRFYAPVGFSGSVLQLGRSVRAALLGGALGRVLAGWTIVS